MKRHYMNIKNKKDKSDSYYWRSKYHALHNYNGS